MSSNRKNKGDSRMSNVCEFCRQRPGPYVSLYGNDICSECLAEEEKELAEREENDADEGMALEVAS